MVPQMNNMKLRFSRKVLRDGLCGFMIALLVLTTSAPAIAQSFAPTWAHQNGSLTSNGAIVIKSLSGGSYTGTENPSGAVVKTNQNAVSAPPTIIVQATASPPVETLGAACNAATDTMGITADHTLILTCQSGGNVGDYCSPVGSKGAALGTGAPLVCQ